MVSDALEGEIARVTALSFPDRGGVVPAAFDFGAAHDASPRQRACGFRAGHDKSWPALHTLCIDLNPANSLILNHLENSSRMKPPSISRANFRGVTRKLFCGSTQKCLNHLGFLNHLDIFGGHRENFFVGRPKMSKPFRNPKAFRHFGGRRDFFFCGSPAGLQKSSFTTKPIY